VHRVTLRAPNEMLEQERDRLHPIPASPHTVAFGLTRAVQATTPMVSIRRRSVLRPGRSDRSARVGASAWPPASTSR
jgi:hypothetical protein